MTDGRPLPDEETDWDLFTQLVRVHQSVTVPNVWDRHLYDWWAKWNQTYFDSRLRPLFVHTGNSDYGKWLGLCCYGPTREIFIQKKNINAPIFAERSVVSVRRHEKFKDLSPDQYGVALVLLHEMIHQACFEAGANPDHQGGPWAAHCNHIGADLGLGLTYTAMKRSKVTERHPDGSKGRKNVWVPLTPTEPLPGTDRLASFSECRCFPFRDEDPFIVANTAKGVDKDGREVKTPPMF